MASGCGHQGQIRDVSPTATGCEDCLRAGTRWVQLRVCMSCGHVGCCDSSPSRHARAHFHASQHPIIQSYEPGQSWRWCYVDAVYLPEGPELSYESASSTDAP